MKAFAYIKAADSAAALEHICANDENDVSFSGASRAQFLAGGTNLLDLMKENLASPVRVIDINGLPFNTVTQQPDGSLRLGALARNADTAYHPFVREHLPMLSSAILAGASAQIRNMASNGGNLLQRTRCVYFYDTHVPCNKREPGTGCPAKDGLARQHAILGASRQCIAVHPSDMCVALAALDAKVRVRSARGERDIPFADFHRLPGDTPEQDTTLEHDELIDYIAIPTAKCYAAHSVYLKLRERQSYAFALVSVAAALDIGEDGRIRSARLALGGVAHKPWRDLSAERAMAGELPSDSLFEGVAKTVLKDAVSYGVGPGSNAFKIPMARRAIVRALQVAARGTVTNTGGNLS